MRYTKFFQYAYLVFGALFLYKVIAIYLNVGEVHLGYLLLAALAIFVFFFRRNFNKKFENKDK